MAEALRDKYANIMTFTITEVTNGTAVFAEVNTNVGIDSSRRSGVAVLIDEIDYMLSPASVDLMNANAEHIRFAITVSNAVTDLSDMTDRRILHSGYFMRDDFGTAASAQFIQQPMVFQFFPPLITAEKSIFLGIQSGSMSTLPTLSARLFFRTVQISAEEFVEIAEVFRLVS